MAGANAWGAFGALQYIIYEYDNLSDGGVRASESPAKSVFRHIPSSEARTKTTRTGGGEGVRRGRENKTKKKT